MAMSIIKVRNVTENPLPMDNLNVENRTLPPEVDIELTLYNKVYEIQSDPQLQQYIEEGLCILNDGTRDLTQEEATNVVAPVISTANMYDFTEAPEKIDVTNNDLFLIEDSEDDYKKKKVRSESILFLGEGTIVYTPERIVETGIVYTNSTDPILLHGMYKEIEEAGNYEIEFSGQFACLKGWEVIMLALYVDNEIVPDTRRIIEAESYVAGLTDALIPNVQQNQIIHVRWWTDRGRKVIAEARSLKVSRYV